MEVTKKINNFKHELIYSPYVLSDTTESQNKPEKKVLYRKEYNTIKILVHIRNHVLDISLNCRSIYTR